MVNYAELTLPICTKAKTRWTVQAMPEIDICGRK
jgi:hypothetical protein